MTKRSPLPTTLAVLMNGRPVGQVERNGNRLTFTYDDSWLTAKNSFPLSLSMRPTGGSSFGHDAIYNWPASLGYGPPRRTSCDSVTRSPSW